METLIQKQDTNFQVYKDIKNNHVKISYMKISFENFILNQFFEFEFILEIICYRLICVLQKFNRFPDVTAFGERNFKEVIKVK